MMPSPGRKLNILVVDDSAVIRRIATAILTGAGMNVTVASDPIIAMEKMKRQRPDVIVLDIEMPRMDGLTFLRKIMAEDPIPVVICSSLAGEGTETSFQGLDEGAVSIVTKPKLGVLDFMEESSQVFIDAVRGAAAARIRHGRRQPPRTASAISQAPSPALLTITTDKVVAIGASTGGTEALRTILEVLPADAPGIVIVQHMPEGFTAAFAQRLNTICGIEVKEAVDGDRILAGRALIARGNKHLTVQRSGAHYVVRVSDGPLISRHRPSVDVLFRSVALAAGRNAVGVILTGMGDDGADGLCDMKTAGATTLAQDEESCVVFGMPKEAIERGGVDQVLPLSRIPNAILTHIRRIA